MLRQRFSDLIAEIYRRGSSDGLIGVGEAAAAATEATSHSVFSVVFIAPTASGPRTFIIHRMPTDWQATYSTSGTMLGDPRITAALHADHGFSWSELDWSAEEAQKLLIGLRNAGVPYGWTFPFRGAGGVIGAWSVAGRDQVNFTPEEIHLLSCIAHSILMASMPAINASLGPRVELTMKESIYLACLSAGLTAEVIAKKMQVSIRTVHYYRDRILEKTSSKSTLQAAVRAAANGVLPLGDKPSSLVDGAVIVNCQSARAELQL